jgi:hypothetical protein
MPNNCLQHGEDMPNNCLQQHGDGIALVVEGGVRLMSLRLRLVKGERWV